MSWRFPRGEAALRAEAALSALSAEDRVRALVGAAEALDRAFGDRVLYTITGSVLRGTALRPAPGGQPIIDALLVGGAPRSRLFASACQVRLLRAEPIFAGEGLRALVPGVRSPVRIDPTRQSEVLHAAIAADPLAPPTILLLKRWARSCAPRTPSFGLEMLTCWAVLAAGPAPSLVAGLDRVLGWLAGGGHLGLCFPDAPGAMDPFDPAPHYLGCPSWRGTNTLAALRLGDEVRLRDAAKRARRDLAPTLG